MERRKLLEYGLQKKQNDSHLLLCDGIYCEREDCPTGQAWRLDHGKILVDHPEKGKTMVDKPK